MKSAFSTTWKKSKQPRKQRKYRYNVPHHTRGKFLGVNLSKALRKKHGTRTLRLRKGDKVKIVRGSLKGKEGKVERINVIDCKIYISKIELARKDGSKVQPPLRPSNLVITELEMGDKKRVKRLSGKPESTPAKGSAEKKETKKVKKPEADKK